MVDNAIEQNTMLVIYFFNSIDHCFSVIRYRTIGMALRAKIPFLGHGFCLPSVFSCIGIVRIVCVNFAPPHAGHSRWPTNQRI